MKKFYRDLVAGVLGTCPFGISAAWAQNGGTSDALSTGAPPWFAYLIIFLVVIGAIVSILLIRRAAANSKWSLTDALSEEVTVTAMTSDGSGGQKPLLDSAGAPMSVTVLCASSSRLIALMGLMVIMLMFLGFGTFALYRFAATGAMPSGINDVVKFLVAGLTMFAPYLVNKFASIFESLTPKA